MLCPQSMLPGDQQCCHFAYSYEIFDVHVCHKMTVTECSKCKCEGPQLRLGPQAVAGDTHYLQSREVSPLCTLCNLQMWCYKPEKLYVNVWFSDTLGNHQQSLKTNRHIYLVKTEPLQPLHARKFVPACFNLYILSQCMRNLWQQQPLVKMLYLSC